jgi:hypothetical protein
MAPTGRPSKIDQVVKTRPDGTTLTAGQQVIDRVQLGLDLQASADSAGISRATLHKWRLRGARHRADQTQGRKVPTADLRFVEFVDALERAEAEAEANRLAIIQGAAQGGHEVTRVTVKTNRDGQVLERTEVRETLRPEWTAAAWWLERRKPHKYARRLEVSTAESLVSAEDGARVLANELRDYLQGVEDGRAQAEADA